MKYCTTCKTTRELLDFYTITGSTLITSERYLTCIKCRNRKKRNHSTMIKEVIDLIFVSDPATKADVITMMSNIKAGRKLLRDTIKNSTLSIGYTGLHQNNQPP